MAIVNSRYGAFGAWSACSVKCGMGTQTRTRTCIAGNECGAGCTGPLSETRSCGMAIVNSKFGAYGAWSECSTKCGMGTQTRTRPCIAGNECGAPCRGESSETRSCGSAIVDSKWGSYGAWSACSVKGGTGTQTRTRVCQRGNECGAPCTGPASESRSCGTAIVNSKMGAYGAWSACSVKCGMGTQTRTRPCIAGNECGAGCTGPLSETRSCGTAIIDSRYGAYGE